MFRVRIPSISFLGRVRTNTRGAVAVIGALSLTSMIGMGALAVEATRGYAAKVTNQRVADAAALAGALAYNASGDNQDRMRATVRAVVAAQGLDANSANIQLVSEGTRQLVQVTITTSIPLMLGKVLTNNLSFDVESVGAAVASNITAVAPPCIAAIGNTGGITLTGGTAINSPGCAINTNSTVTVPYGTSITAQQVNASGTITNPGNAITTTPSAGNINANKPNAASDWISSNTGLMAALCQVNKLTGLTDADYADNNTNCISSKLTPVTVSSTSTTDWTLGYRPKSDGGVHAYQLTDYSCDYVIPQGSYDIRTLSVSGGCKIRFTAGSTLKFRDITVNGDMTVPDGDFIVTGTLTQNANLTIGNGNHSFGTITISGGRILTIGSGNFNLTNTINISGGTKIYISIGPGNTVAIGGGGGTAINIGGGSILCFTAVSGSGCAAPTAEGGTFSVDGSVSTAGGSTVVFPKAPIHIINGNFASSGTMVFGSGTYILKGNFQNGTGGMMSGSDVTFALGGVLNLSGGTSLDLAAPGGSSSYGVPGLLFATKSASASTIGGGANGKYAGLVYSPKGDLTLSGGASMSSNGSACLMMIVRALTLSGGTSVASACSSIATSGGIDRTVALYR